MGKLVVREEEGMEVVVMEAEERETVAAVAAAVEKEERENEMGKWEKVMPRMVLRVLLVEADDSTRQILAALLRKCNYKVAAVSDGLKAWEILRRRHSNIDLILTEVDLPSISGYALLTLIMEHDSCKDIPVIMMSSQDSISMVYKCMLKGAADFLIKPVRRNELKNLWRHVWRKLAIDSQHTPTLAAQQYKVEAASDNNAVSNRSSDNASSCWRSTKHTEDASDIQAHSQLQSHLRSSGLSENELLQHRECVKSEKESALHNNNTKGIEHCNEADISAASSMEEDGSCTGTANEYESMVPGEHGVTSNDTYHGLAEPSREAMNLIGRIDDHNERVGESSSNAELNGFSFAPQLELSLHRFYEPDKLLMDDTLKLNHSSASAFSWYSNNKKVQNISLSLATAQTQKERETNIEKQLVPPEETAVTSPWHSKLLSNKDYATNDIDSHPSHGVFPSPPQVPAPTPELTFDGASWTSYDPMGPSVFNPQKIPTELSPKSTSQREESPVLASSDQGFGESEAVDDQKIMQNGEQNVSCDAYQSGSSTLCNGLTSQRQSGVYGSISEVTDGNATSTILARRVSGDESVKDDVSSTLVHDQFRRTGHHSAEREAALAKFRLKRKDRCFEKKVRYQSRKRLAEQRPRVKGQFVRQVPPSVDVATTLDASG